MFKLLSQTTVVEDFNDDAHAATKALGSAFAAGYNKAKGKIQSDKEKAAADAEQSARDKEAEEKKQAELDVKAKGDDRLQSTVHSIFSFLPVPPLEQGELIDRNGTVKDLEWHQLTAEEFTFIKKYMNRINSTYGEFRAQLEKRLMSASFLTNQERKSVSQMMGSVPTEIDTNTHVTVNRAIADEIIAMLKTGSIKTGIDACVKQVKGYAGAMYKAKAMTAPLAVDRGLMILGCVLNNYQDRLASVTNAIDKYEFSRVLNPQETEDKAKEQEQKKSEPTASMQKPDPAVKEGRKLVSFRPLTESEA